MPTNFETLDLFPKETTPVIDVTNPTPEQAEKLFQFLESQVDKVQFWSSLKIHQLGDYQFKISLPIFAHPKKDKKQWTYEAYDPINMVGSGAYGRLFNIPVTITRNADGSARYKKAGTLSKKTNLPKERVVKLQTYSQKTPQTKITLEQQLTAQFAPYIASKEPAFNAGGLTFGRGFTAMRKLPGKTLEWMLIKEGHLLSPRKRLDITKALLKNFKQYITEQNVVHNDLKDGNILIDINEQDNQVIAYILDWAFAQTLDEKQSLCGTPLFMGPERFKPGQQVVQASDIWSLGTILYLLWGGIEQQKIDPETKKICRIDDKNRYGGFPPYLDSLFTDLAINNDKIQDTIKQCLAGFFLKDPEQRISIDKVIEIFDSIDPNQLADTVAQPQSNLAGYSEAIQRPSFQLAKQSMALDSNQKRVMQTVENISLEMENTKNPNLKRLLFNKLSQAIEDNKKYFKNTPEARELWRKVGLTVASGGIYYVASRISDKLSTAHFQFFKQKKAATPELQRRQFQFSDLRGI